MRLAAIERQACSGTIGGYVSRINGHDSVRTDTISGIYELQHRPCALPRFTRGSLDDGHDQFHQRRNRFAHQLTGRRPKGRALVRRGRIRRVGAVTRKQALLDRIPGNEQIDIAGGARPTTPNRVVPPLPHACLDPGCRSLAREYARRDVAQRRRPRRPSGMEEGLRLPSAPARNPSALPDATNLGSSSFSRSIYAITLFFQDKREITFKFMVTPEIPCLNLNDSSLVQ